MIRTPVETGCLARIRRRLLHRTFSVLFLSARRSPGGGASLASTDPGRVQKKGVPPSQDALWSENECGRRLQISAALLFAFDRFKEGFEVARSERACALTLDDLVKDRGSVLDGLGKDL